MSKQSFFILIAIGSFINLLFMACEEVHQERPAKTVPQFSPTNDSLIANLFVELGVPPNTVSDNRLMTIAAIHDRAFALSNYASLDAGQDTFLYRMFFEKSITLARNDRHLLPVRGKISTPVHVLNLGATTPRLLQRLEFYTSTQALNESQKLSDSTLNLLIINKLRLEKHPEIVDFLNQNQKNPNVVLINFENLKNLQFLSGFKTVIQAYESNATTHDLVAQLIFGSIAAAGRLPVEVSPHFRKGQGEVVSPILRLEYTLPEAVGMSSARLQNIENLMAHAIRKKGAPGGQVLIAKSGKVVYYQAFGHFTYSDEQPVSWSSLYDLASVTKAAATTLAVMKLYEEGKIDLEKTVKTYWTATEKTYIGNLKLRHLLIHRSGLPPNPPIAQFVRLRDTTSRAFQTYFSSFPKEGYEAKITDNLYLNASAMNEELWKDIFRIRPRTNPSYGYSDLNFLLLQKVCEAVAEKPLDAFLKAEFYDKMGLHRIGFNPLKRFSKETIAPTVLDYKWRHRLLQGEVHDEAAALLNGVAGNAGLFSDANDLAAVFQMLLNGGEYAGERFLKKETIDFFTSSKHGGYRGLGFDKKSKNSKVGCYEGASRATFGHSGFTGTCVWADPEAELIYVFLSNRVHQNPKNFRLTTFQTREFIHREAFKAFQ